MTSVALPILGLAGDQNPSAAPKGAMSEADNVVCDLPGQARPRPNTSVVYSVPAAFERCDAVLSFNGEWLAHDPTDGWRNAAFDELTELGTVGAGNATDLSKSEPQGAQARSSMYIAHTGGVARVGSPTAQDIEQAGLDVPFAPAWPNVPNITGVSGPFTAPVSVAYRAVLKRTDSNGYVKRSPPTPAYAVRDSSTMSNNAFIIAGPNADERWYFGDTGFANRIVALKTGDEVEFYRTKSIPSATAAVAPDYYLVKTYIVTAADVSNGYIAPPYIYDDIPDDQLGEALYTNPAQGGALSAKFNPPDRAVSIAHWNRCLWVGDGWEAGQAALTFEEGTALQHIRITSGTITSGLATITGVPSVTGISVGMYVTDSTATGPLAVAVGVIPWATKVISITGAGPYTVTMNKNATGNLTLSGVNDVWFHHCVTLDGAVDFVADADPNSNPRQFALSTSDAGRTAVNFANAVRVASSRGLQVWETGTAPAHGATSIADTGAAVGTGAPGLVAVRRLDRGDLEVEMSAADGVRPLPPYPGAMEFPARARANRLWWSAPDEPEAFPILNYVDLGDSRASIQRIVPLRDAMLVFTTTGLYRVSGTPPGNWSVDLLDASLRLVRSECVDVLDGTAYAFTNRGVVKVSEQGVVDVVSQGKVEEDLADAMKLCLDDPAQRGARVLCWEREALVLVALPTDPIAENSVTSSEVLCYAPLTGGWSRWPNQFWSAGASNGISGYPYVAATREDGAPLYEIRQLVDARGYDAAFGSITVTSGAGTSTLVITDANRGNWYPRVGDWILCKTVPDVYRRIIGVSYAAPNWTLTLDGASPTPMASLTGAFEGAPVLLEWLPSVLGTTSPFTFSNWREASFSFHGGPAGTLADITTARITFGVRHDFSQTPAELVGTPDRAAVELRPYRFGWPRNASRRAACFPRLGFSEMLWVPRLAGILVVGEPGSERVRT